MQLNRTAILQTQRMGNVKISKINAIFLLAVCILGFVYLIFINRLAIQSYTMRDLEKRFTALKEVNQKMEIELTELRSIDSLKNQAAQLGLVPVVKIQYIQVNSGVALNR